MTLSQTNVYSIRDKDLSDEAFIIVSFLKALYYGKTWYSKIPKDIFMDNYKHIAKILFDKGTIKVACLKEDPSIIIGFAILSGNNEILHFVYVRKNWRNIGVAKSLIPSTIKAVTHLTPTGESLLPKLTNAVFNPFVS